MLSGYRRHTECMDYSCTLEIILHRHTGVLLWDLDFRLGGCSSELSVCRECLLFSVYLTGSNRQHPQLLTYFRSLR